MTAEQNQLRIVSVLAGAGLLLLSAVVATQHLPAPSPSMTRFSKVIGWPAGTLFPQTYRQGAFVAQRGSWNRSTLSGYKVLFVPFKDGRPSGVTKDFLTGFIANAQTSEVYGRPVGVTMMPDGALLVADDAGGKVWRVSRIESR